VAFNAFDFVTHCWNKIFSHNIAIKKIFCKKDNFEPWMSKGQGKLKNQGT